MRDLGNLAVKTVARQPESAQQIEDILKDIRHNDPDPGVREAAGNQLKRIAEQSPPAPPPPGS